MLSHSKAIQSPIRSSFAHLQCAVITPRFVCHHSASCKHSRRTPPHSGTRVCILSSSINPDGWESVSGGCRVGGLVPAAGRICFHVCRSQSMSSNHLSFCGTFHSSVTSSVQSVTFRPASVKNNADCLRMAGSARTHRFVVVALLVWCRRLRL